MSNRIFLVMAVPASKLPTVVGEPPTRTELRPMEVLVDVSVDSGSTYVIDVSAITDAGDELDVMPRLSSSCDGGSSVVNLISISFPRWIRFRWQGADEVAGRRELADDAPYDFQVDVLNRIPCEAFCYAAARPGCTIALKFRIKDYGVMFAWAVQECSEPADARVSEMADGDF